jgi:hypothetical protein
MEGEGDGIESRLSFKIILMDFRGKKQRVPKNEGELSFKKIITLYFCLVGFSLRKRVLMRKLFFAISTERFQHTNFLKRPEVWVKKAYIVFQRYSIYIKLLCFAL